jgi:hypothetical protein
MADDAVIPVDLADQPELVRADNNHNNIEYVTVVDIMLLNVPPIIAITECVAHKGSNGYLKLMRCKMVIRT